MLRPIPSRLAAVVLAGLGLLAACGGDDASDTSGTTATTEADAPVTTGDAVDCGAAPGETVTVEIPDFEFAPDPVRVGTCDAIVWSNAHDQAHTSTKSGDTGWSTDTIAAGADSEPIVFDTPGELTYMCALHPFMTGTVEVS